MYDMQQCLWSWSTGEGCYVVAKMHESTAVHRQPGFEGA
jgi:hypothetical protein